jgi:putative tricarboxylic transport membrane protein
VSTTPQVPPGPAPAETVEEGAAGDAAPVEGGPPAAVDAASGGPVIGPRVAGGVLLAAGILLFVNAIGAAVQDGVTLGGPRLGPLIVTGGWVVLAAVYCVRQVVAPEGGRFVISTPLMLMAGLVAYALVLKYTVVGYVIATALVFLFVARLLNTHGVRDFIVRDLVVAVALSLGIYLAFTRLLGISLPAGVLPL